MPLITSAGVGSGLDLESIIKASIDAENIPKMQKFIEKDQRLQVELSSVGEVKSAISKLEDTVKKLADVDNFNKRTASLTQPSSGDLVSVTTNSNSTAGNFDIEVVQLAQGSRAVSNAGLFTTNTDVVTASGGKLTFTAGTKNFDITLSAGATLEDLRTAINESQANFGVSANIVNTGSEAKLVLSSNVEGAGNDLVITNDTAELDNVSTVANGGGPGGLAVAAADQAKDGIIKVDGLTIQNDSNTFTDAVQDLTIKALAESQSGETARLRVNYDTDEANKLLDEFISNYNNLIGVIGYQTRPDQGLSGDAAMRSFQSQLITSLSSEITGAGPFSSIFDLGITVDKKGYLEKSSLVRSFNEALDDNFDDVGKAFAGTGGMATQLESLLTAYTDSNGILKSRETSINGQIEDLKNDVANHEYRMEQFEVRLRKQYSSLDVLVAKMQSTQSYLSSQLASLPGFTSKKS